MTKQTQYAYAYKQNVCYKRDIYTSDCFYTIKDAEESAKNAYEENRFRILSIFSIDTKGVVRAVRNGEEFMAGIDKNKEDE